VLPYGLLRRDTRAPAGRVDDWRAWTTRTCNPAFERAAVERIESRRTHARRVAVGARERGYFCMSHLLGIEKTIVMSASA